MYNLQTEEPGVKAHMVRLIGGAASIAKDGDAPAAGGYGITATRTGTGAYKLAWGANPGVFQGWSCDLGAATPANLAGHTVVRDTYDASAHELDFSLFNASDAAHDLANNEYVDIVVYFKG